MDYETLVFLSDLKNWLFVCISLWFCGFSLILIDELWLKELREIKRFFTSDEYILYQKP